MKEKLSSIAIVFSILLGIYFFINIEVLIWRILEPEGFWGWVWFFFASSLTFLIIEVLFEGFINTFIFIREWKSKRKFPWKLIAIYIAINIFGLLYFYIPGKFIHGLSDKYKYVEKSEDYFSEGEFSEALVYAEKIYTKAIEKDEVSPILIMPYIYEKYFKDERLNNIRIYQATLNYAYCHQALGKDIAKADSLYNACLNLSKDNFPEEKEYLIPPLIGLSAIYIAKGDNTKVEQYYQELSPLLYELEGSDVMRSIEVLKIYSLFTQKNGDYEQSIQLRKQALTIYETSDKSKKSIYYLRLLIRLSDNYIDISEFEQSGELMLKADEFAHKKRKKEVYLDYLEVKARLFFNLIRYPEIRIPEKEKSIFKRIWNSFTNTRNRIEIYKEETEKLLNKIAKERKKRNGETHIDYARSLKNLAEYYLFINDYPKAEKSIAKALKIAINWKKDYQHDYYSLLLTNALIQNALGEEKRSLDEISQIENFIYQQINENFTLLTGQQKETYISKYENVFDIINSVYVSCNKPNLTGRIYNNILANKSVALFSNLHFRNSIYSSGKKDLIDLYNYLEQIRGGLENLSLTKNVDPELSYRKVDSLLQAEKLILTELKNTTSFSNFKVNAINWNDIKESLKDNEVAIEFIKVPIKSQQLDSIGYFALIVSNKSKEPDLIFLFMEKELDNILNKRDTISTSDKINLIYSGDSKEKLRELIWLPLTKSKYFTDTCKVYLSLSGILHQVSFPALTIDEDCEISIVSSTRTLIGKKDSQQTNDTIISSATLYGGIKYEQEKENTESEEVRGFSSLNSIKKSLIRNGFEYLKFTGIEIDSIYKILDLNEVWICDTLKGAKATESSFIDLATHQPNIVHLATHGFYYPIAKSYEASKILFNSSDFSSALKNPLYRSGLIMAGANNTDMTDQTDNGILTSYEISKIDLTEVDLAVLSACETGLGDIKGYEGVYGLQRAFILAGVNSLIISLWRIPDKETSQLMHKFYKYYIVDELPKHQALRLAQRDIKNSKKHNEPFYWAGFTLIE